MCATEIDEPKKFELQVGYLYELLGFRVERNISIGGQEVDILATRFFPGVGEVRLLVECKWRRKGSVSNQEVYKFREVVNALRSVHLVTRGIMVTNRAFSQYALSFAQKLDEIDLITITELENQLFDVRQAFRAAVEKYEAEPIFLSYIPLHASWQNSDESEKGTSEDIGADLEKWVLAFRAPLISVLADYGLGKTTLLKRIKYNFINRYLFGASRLIPLFLPLIDFSRHGNLDDFLRYVLAKELERDIPLSIFWRVLKEGGFLLLLDGFDEMSSAVDTRKKRDNFLALSPLFRDKSKAIITCRPAFFVSAAEHNNMVAMLRSKRSRSYSQTTATGELARRAEALRNRLLLRTIGQDTAPMLESASATVVHLDLLNEGQINLYLRKFDVDYRSLCACGWEEVRNFLFSVYDLRDLMTRPILLDIVNDTILQGKIGVNSDIEVLGPSSLYEIYTSNKLDQDWNKGEMRQLISREDRGIFAEALALAMFQSEKGEMSYPTLLELVKKGLGLPVGARYLERLQPAVLAADLQVCTFLTRSDDQIFRFSHRSFMEFFVALHLKKRILDEDFSSPLFFMNLPKEILYFLGAFAIPEPRIRDLLLRAHYNSDPKQDADGSDFFRNVAGALLYSGRTQQDLRLEGLTLAQLDLKKTSFLRAKWKGVRFAESEWRDVRMSYVVIDGLSLKSVHVQLWDIDKSRIAGEAAQSRIVQVSSIDSKINLSAKEVRIEKGRFEGGNLKIAGDLEVCDSEFHKPDLELDGFLGNGIHFRGCQFSETILICNGKVKLDDCHLRNCAVFCLRLNLGSMAEESQPSRVAGSLLTAEGAKPSVKLKRPFPFEDCEGILITHGGGTEEAELIAELNSCNNFLCLSAESWSDAAKRTNAIKSFEPWLTKRKKRRDLLAKLESDL